jgi:hypothetical protein
VALLHYLQKNINTMVDGRFFIPARQVYRRATHYGPGKSRWFALDDANDAFVMKTTRIDDTGCVEVGDVVQLLPISSAHFKIKGRVTEIQNLTLTFKIIFITTRQT